VIEDCHFLQKDITSPNPSSFFLLFLNVQYVDENYSGHGVGEYQYWDRKNKRWDSTECQKVGNTERCVPMDCHVPDSTTFTLLGYFKEARYDLWFDTLFEYQGDCLLTDEEYSLMNYGLQQEDQQSSSSSLPRPAWPTECTESIYTNPNNGDGDESSPLYYDTRPLSFGRMSVALYSDDRCTQLYSGTITVQDALKGMVCGGYTDGGAAYESMCSNVVDADDDGGDGDGSSSSTSSTNGDDDNHYDMKLHLQKWNDAFDVFKQCQPCKAFDLTHIMGGHGYQRDDTTRYSGAYSNNNQFMCSKDYSSSNDDAAAAGNDDGASGAVDYSNLNQVLYKMCPESFTMTSSLFCILFRSYLVRLLLSSPRE
jgi:hypothetical protein